MLAPMHAAARPTPAALAALLAGLLAAARTALLPALLPALFPVLLPAPLAAPLAALLAALLAAAPAADAAPAAAADVLIFGELHDQPDQQRQVAAEVQRLASEGRLAAVVLEMAEQPHSTTALGRSATPAEVRSALAWRGWDWEPYADVVMNAVRAGVPVVGGNLPRAQLPAAMADTALDALVPGAVHERLAQAVRAGHCDLLPEAQVPGMVRVQIARDRALAQAVAERARLTQPQQTVLLLTGAQHASRDRGVPLHLAAADPQLPVRVVMFGDTADGRVADEHRAAEVTPQADHCAELRRSLGTTAPAASAPR